MLRSVRGLYNYVLEAEDGEIGRCKDFLFDDVNWTIRYMVADTGKWLPGRKVLISSLSLGDPDWATRQFPVKLTKEQIENAPPLDKDAPVSRLYEQKHFDYFRWPYYWAGGSIWGPTPYPYVPAPPLPEDELQKIRQEQENIHPEESHLRSVKEVNGYHIQAEGGEIGHVEDFIIEDDVWTIRYMIVDTRNWLSGRKVLVSPGWIDSISWPESKVSVDLTVEAIKNGPEYDPSVPVNRVSMRCGCTISTAARNTGNRPFHLAYKRRPAKRRGMFALLNAIEAAVILDEKTRINERRGGQ